MKVGHKIIAFSVIAGGIVWVADSIVDYLFFYEGEFWDLAILNVPPHELYVRSVMLAGFLAFGVVISKLMAKRTAAEQQIADLAKFPSEDPNPVLRISRQGAVLLANKAGEELLADLKACTCVKKDQSLPAPWFRSVTEVLDSGSSKEVEFQCEDKILSLTFAPVKNSDYVNIYGLDITVRKRAEQEYKNLLQAEEERIKELRCMYGVTNSVRKHETLEAIFEDVAAMIPPGWQYPQITRGRVCFDGKEYVSESFDKTPWKQTSELVVNGVRRGFIEACYLEEKPMLDEGPFLKEERNLIDAIARTVSEAVEHKQAEEGLRNRREALEELVTARTKELEERNVDLEHEIEERKRVELALHKAQEQLISGTRLAAIGQVSASIAHDLRNPLGTVRNACYFVRHHLLNSEPKVLEHLGIIDQEVIKADLIITNLLEMARPKVPRKHKVNLVEMVKEVFSGAKGIKAVRCLTSVVPDPFLVWADPVQLRQVISNIVSNAVDAMKGQGKIVVEATCDSDYDTLVFRDTGPGFSKEVRERLFEPLVTTKAGGTGLGLTICRQIIEKHGGTIDAENCKAHSATIRIRLPRQ